MAIDGRPVTRTAQTLWFLRYMRTAEDGTDEAVTAIPSRTGIFYTAVKALPDAALQAALRSQPTTMRRHPWEASDVGLLCWEGVVTLGSLGGFELRGVIRRASAEEAARFAANGRL